MRNFFLLLISTFCLSGCAMLSRTAETSFSIEKNDLADCEGWQILMCDGEDDLSFSIPADSSEFSLELPKNVVLGILAYPVKNGRKLKPLGAVYPYSLKLTEKEGFPAYVADRLYRSATDSPNLVQDFISKFNWPKFMESCNEFENPWTLDRDRIVKAIASGNFKKSDLKDLGAN